MDDVVFFAFAEAVVGYVDEQYGRVAAWLAVGGMLAVFVASITALVWWISS